MKIKGLDALTRQLKEAENVLKELDGDLVNVTFDPHDPGSIEAAIKQVESTIDERVGNAGSNPIIAPLVEGMKEEYRKGILERAAAARLTKADENDD